MTLGRNDTNLCSIANVFDEEGADVVVDNSHSASLSTQV